jgi:hypothetical protein
VNIAVPVGDQFILRFRKSDEKVNACQQDGKNDGSFDLQTLIHVLLICLELFFGNQARDGTPCDLQFDVIRLDSYYQGIITRADRNNGADDTARGLHDVPVLQPLKHLLHLFLLLLHRHEQQEVEDRKNSDDRKKSEKRIRLALQK